MFLPSFLKGRSPGPGRKDRPSSHPPVPPALEVHLLQSLKSPIPEASDLNRDAPSKSSQAKARQRKSSSEHSQAAFTKIRLSKLTSPSQSSPMRNPKRELSIANSQTNATKLKFTSSRFQATVLVSKRMLSSSRR